MITALLTLLQFSLALSLYLSVYQRGFYPSAYFSGCVYDNSSDAYYVTGSFSPGTFLSKISPNGTFIWTVSFNSSFYNEGYAVALDPLSRDILLIGRSGDTLFGVGSDFYAFLARFRPNSTMIYLAVLGPGSNDLRYFGLVDPSRQTVLTVGETGGLGAVAQVSYLSNGSTIQSFGFIADGRGYGLALSDPGSPDVFVSGDYNDGYGSNGAFISRINIYNMSVIWSCQIPVPELATLASVVYDPISQMVFGFGCTSGTFNGMTVNDYRSDVAAVSYSASNGSLIWTVVFGTDNDDAVQSASLLPASRNLIMAGYYNNSNGLVLIMSQNGTVLQMQAPFESSNDGYGFISMADEYNGFIADTSGYLTFVNLTDPAIYTTFSSASTVISSTQTSSTIISSQSNTISPSFATTSGGQTESSPVPSTQTSFSEGSSFPSTQTETFVSPSNTLTTLALKSTSTVQSLSTTPTSSAISTASTSISSVSTLTSTRIALSSLLVTSTYAFSSSPQLATSDHRQASTSAFLNPVLLFPDQASSSTSSTTLNVNPDAQQDFLSGSNYIYVIAGAAGFLLLTVGVAVALVIKKRRNANPKDKISGFSGSFINSSLLSASSENSTKFSMETQSNINNTSMFTQNTTLMRTDFEMSLPGYLQRNALESFVLDKKLAQGGGGSVYLANSIDSKLSIFGPKIIVKIVGKNQKLDSLPAKGQRAFKQEISIMHYFRQEKHIAKLLGWSDDPAAMIMKFYHLGSLDKWIDSKSAVKTKALIMSFIRDICQGVLVMHSTGFVHCDLKPQNILLDEDDYGRVFCVLTDFGITNIVSTGSLLVENFQVENLRGLSVSFAAPEVFERFRAKQRLADMSLRLLCGADIYALGVINCELFCRKEAWE